MNRKEFIQWCACACAFPALALTGCKTAEQIPAAYSEGKLSLPLAGYGNRKFAVIKNAKLPAPLYLTRNSEGSFSAVLLQCTHKNCELRPSPTVLTCPCHGSEFSTDGKVLSPPAVKPLTSFPVTADTEKIIIQL
jgi:cytochrome b6-f complex iron-sulfur subunit